MTVQSIVENRLIEDASSVWLLETHRKFGYSDGVESERYLQRVLAGAKDLSSRSAELEIHIKDWPSEYHLTTKRGQLLSGFNFDRGLRVLEVGCGCGAITRHLGESFDQVVSIEGNLNRARLARQRTRDLASVSIVCAPFQQIRFKQKFDIVFCIGVYEYLASFIEGDDPYDAALKYFADMLNPNGIVVIAIENQFGLKYFSGVGEDHLGVPFEGLEGYHRRPAGVRTFGKAELEANLRRHFTEVCFYYPYPDYKLPDCVVSSAFLASGRAGELVSQLKSRDYTNEASAQWDEAGAALELSRNGMLEFFANSFLVIACRGELRGVAFDQEAVLYSTSRRPPFRTCTAVVRSHDGQLIVRKRLRDGGERVERGSLRLAQTDAPWIDAQSLQTSVMLNARRLDRPLGDIFAPCRPWHDRLKADAMTENGVQWLPGEHVDSIWPNAYPRAGECVLVDREWTLSERVRLNVVVIRAIYDFLSKIEAAGPCAASLSRRKGRRLITDIAATFGAELASRDFDEFIRLESELQWLVFGVDRRRQAVYLRWYLSDRPSLHAFRRLKRRASGLATRIRGRLSRLATA